MKKLMFCPVLLFAASLRNTESRSCRKNLAVFSRAAQTLIPAGNAKEKSSVSTLKQQPEHSRLHILHLEAYIGFRNHSFAGTNE